MNINMTDITEKTENGELVTNRDQLVVMDNIEPLIKIIRGQQVMLDRDLATLSTEQCRSVSASLDNGIPSIGNTTTLARIRQAYRRSVSQIGRG